jgi:thioredoxin reductase (NADPH)
LQAAIQLGRSRRSVVVVDKGDGRSALCRSYRNVLGYPDGVSGETLRNSGRAHASMYGAEFVEAEAVAASRAPGGFVLQCAPQRSLEGRTMLLATGVKDRLPDIPGLRPCLGLTVYICPDCDGYEVKDKRTVVLGSGNAGARMALTLTYFTSKLLYVNHGDELIEEVLLDKLTRHGIPVESIPAQKVLHRGPPEEGEFAGLVLADGRTLEGERAFVAFGGNAVRSDLAAQLGVERMESRHIVTDPRSKMTNVPGVWAAGDLGVHSEQLTIAMGEGQQAAIWIHKWLHRTN